MRDMEQVQVKGPAGRRAKLAKEVKPPSVGKWCTEGGQLCAAGVSLERQEWKPDSQHKVHACSGQRREGSERSFWRQRREANAVKAREFQWIGDRVVTLAEDDRVATLAEDRLNRSIRCETTSFWCTKGMPGVEGTKIV